MLKFDKSQNTYAELYGQGISRNFAWWRPRHMEHNFAQSRYIKKFI